MDLKQSADVAALISSTKLPMESLKAPSAACEVNLQVWDTPGQEVYRSLVKLYYRNVQGVVLVVSLDDTADGLAKQLGSLDYWLEQMSQTTASE